MASEHTPHEIDWGKIIDTALTAPGDLSGVYDRLYNYSFLNKVLLRMQGVHEPVATKQRWEQIGRFVLESAVPKEIIRPVFGGKGKGMRFVPVKCIYTVSDTQGKELPPAKIPDWDVDTALQKLDIKQVAFDELDGNVQGISKGNELAINPVAVYPVKTRFHEIAHIALKHTFGKKAEEYKQHRGVMEFEAEATSHLIINELDLMTPDQASVSRAYIQNWMKGERPPDASIRRVFSATNTILQAGRLAIAPPEQA